MEQILFNQIETAVTEVINGNVVHGNITFMTKEAGMLFLSIMKILKYNVQMHITSHNLGFESYIVNW